MKTKSKLVLGLSILSAATLAAGATSTFAWYVASNGQAQNKTVTGTLSAKSESFSVGDVLLEAEIKSISGNPTLTNENGKTFYYVGNHRVGPIDVASADQTKTFVVDLHGYEIVELTNEEKGEAPVNDVRYGTNASHNWTAVDTSEAATVGATTATHKLVPIDDNPSKLAAADGQYKVTLSGTQIKMGADAATAVALTAANNYIINFNVTLGAFKLYTTNESAWSPQTVNFGLIGTGTDGTPVDESSFQTTLSAAIGNRT